MQSDPPEPDDRESNSPASPRSPTVPARVTSPLLKGSNSGGSAARRSARSELSYVTDKRQNGLGLNGVPPTEHENDIRSDLQEGRDSEVGNTVPIRVTEHVSATGRFYELSAPSLHLATRFWVLTAFVCVCLGGTWP